METYFEEEFNKEQEIEYRLLKPNKRTHRKKFVELCEELLNVILIEHELKHIERHKDRAKMEQLDKDITFVLQKARSKAEGERKGMRGCKEKMKKRAAVQYWSMVVKKKQGKNVSQVRIRKRKKEADIACDEDGTSLREAEEKWEKALDEWEKYKQKRKKNVTMRCWSYMMLNCQKKQKRKRQRRVKC